MQNKIYKEADGYLFKVQNKIIPQQDSQWNVFNF